MFDTFNVRVIDLSDLMSPLSHSVVEDMNDILRDRYCGEKEFIPEMTLISIDQFWQAFGDIEKSYEVCQQVEDIMESFSIYDNVLIAILE